MYERNLKLKISCQTPYEQLKTVLGSFQDGIPLKFKTNIWRSENLIFIGGHKSVTIIGKTLIFIRGKINAFLQISD
jgi:hypothetical protein